ncbi:unnamed protein product [Linum trigynum]
MKGWGWMTKAGWLHIFSTCERALDGRNPTTTPPPSGGTITLRLSEKLDERRSSLALVKAQKTIGSPVVGVSLGIAPLD